MADPGTGAFVNQLMNPPNPFATAGQSAQGLNALMQLRADRAAQDAYQQSIDPQTGQFDIQGFNARLSQIPGGTFHMGQTMQESGRGLAEQGQGVQQDWQGRLDQLGAQSLFLQPLVQKAVNNQAVTAKEIQDMVAGMPSGLVSPQVKAQVSQLTDENARGWLLGAAYANQHATNVAQSFLPGYASQPQGGYNLGFNPNPRSPGFNAPYGVTPQTLTPEHRAQLAQWEMEPYPFTDDQGVYHATANKGDYIRYKGYDPYSVYNNQNMPAPGSTPVIPSGPVSTVTTGRAPVPARGGAPGSPPPAVPQSPGQPSPPLTPPTSQPPQAPTASLPPPIIKQGQEAYAQAQTDAASMPDRIAPLRNAMGLLRTNVDLQTGPGQAQYNQAITAIAAALNLKVPQGTSDLQELTKYLAQNIRAQQTGGTTDLGRLETEASNPNPSTQSRDALQVLLAKTIGTTRLQNAAYDYFNAKYGDPNTAAINSGRFTVETSTWKKQQDPTAYAIDYLTPDQVQRYFGGLSGSFDAKTGKATGEKAQFVQSMRDAKRTQNIQQMPAPTPAAPAPAAPPPPTPTAPAAANPNAPMTPQQMYGGG